MVGSDVVRTTVTATPNHPDASYVIKLDGAEDADGMIGLAVGDNVITVEVTAQDQTSSRTYTVTVYRRSGDATLRDLSLSDVTLDPSFAPGTLVYRASVANSVMETTVTPALNDDGASYEIKLGQAVDDEVIDLAVGDNVITVSVSAEDTTVETRTYRVVVHRQSADATLRELSLSGVTLVPPFVPGTVDYTASVATSVTQTTVTAATTHPDANHVIKLGGVVGRGRHNRTGRGRKRHHRRGDGRGHHRSNRDLHRDGHPRRGRRAHPQQPRAAARPDN